MDANNEIKTLFEMYDVDGSGYISKEELTSALKQLSTVRPTQDEIDRTMKEIDADKDGLISLVEFSEMMGFRDEVKQWRQHFAAADADLSGSVDLGELVAVLMLAGSANPEEEANTLFVMGGKGPNDMLNFDEFVSLSIFKSPLKRRQPVLASVVLEDSAKAKLRDLFSSHNASSKKDFFTKAEIHNVLKKELNFEISEKEAWSLFKKAGVKSTEASQGGSTNSALVKVVEVEVNFHQFVEIMRISMQLVKYREEFMKVDQEGSGNGKLGEESLVLLLRGLGVKSPKRESRRLLKTKEGTRKGLTVDKFIELILKHNLVA